MNNQLISENINLVRGVINKYFPYYKNDEDMFQIGCIGLVKAAQSHDDSKGKFSTYAYSAIRNEILSELKHEQREPDCLSLNASMSDSEDGDKSVSLLDTLVGDTDVDWVDTDSIYQSLSEKEREFIKMKQYGLRTNEIVKLTGYSRETINKSFRKLKRLLNDKGD